MQEQNEVAILDNADVRSFAPVALFIYKRPEHTRLTLQALSENPEAALTDLVVFADGAKTPEEIEIVETTRNIAQNFPGFRSVRLIKRQTNFGLANSIINGVTEILDEYPKTIVLEDDFVTAPSFLTYMNSGLEMYEQDDAVVSIHAYAPVLRGPVPQTFFLRGADCLGWATWRRGWDSFETDGSILLDEIVRRGLTFEFDYSGTYSFSGMLKDQIAGKNDSWAVRWYASSFLKGLLTLHPSESYVSHIGNDGSGTHSPNKPSMTKKVGHPRPTIERCELKENKHGRQAHINYYASLHRPINRVLVRLRAKLHSRRGKLAS
jgi:hypothetical protein